MDEEDELRKALAPVREYFSGKELSVNAVLAAYLRSYGLPVSGQLWEAAARAISQGAGFKEAVLSVMPRSITGVEPSSIGVTQLPAPFKEPSLSWFPKQFGPGDIDGVGAKRLLGTPSIDPAYILVREMGQNSWDARRPLPSFEFILNFRVLKGSVMETLRDRIFTSDPPETGLAELLRHDEIWALEISDRGTVGLDGPIRNDLAIDPGTNTNFIDLVFNIGAPRDVHLGGGTYGFGKTISYLISSVGTILLWSRCEGSNGLEHRLIGSAIGEGFNLDGLRFTGRHWWGNAIAQEGRVEPAVGDVAEELGESVFATRFDRHATGTSILILDPELGGGPPGKNVAKLAEAVVWNLWPKLLAEQSGRSRMNISVQLNGTPVALPVIEQHPVLSGHAECLMAVRTAQGGSDPMALPLRYPVTVEEIWLKRPLKLLGHLALTRYPFSTRAGFPSHSITFMRNQAELVVRYFEREELDVEGFQWAGVFKPVADVDDSFAFAEPPAHDDWVPQAVQDKIRRSEVKMALIRIREAADRYLSPRKPVMTNSEAAPSAAYVGDMLADLLCGLEGPAPSTRIIPPRPTGTSPGSPAGGASSSETTLVPSLSGLNVGAPGSPSSAVVGAVAPDTSTTGTTSSRFTESASVPPLGPANAGATDAGSSTPARAGTSISPPATRGRPAGRPRVNVVGASHVPAEFPGWTRTTLDVQLADGSPPASAVDVSVRVGYDGGSEEDTEVIRIIGWSDRVRDTFSLGPTELPLDVVRQFVFEARSDLAIDVETRVSDRL